MEATLDLQVFSRYDFPALEPSLSRTLQQKLQVWDPTCHMEVIKLSSWR